jgi:drug/metabolite transporter (DMT)-like permease
VTGEQRGALCLVGAALLWSTGGLGIKAVDEPPLAVAFWRSAIAAVALGLFLRPTVRGRGLGFAAAAGAYAACLTTFVVATKWTTAANAIVLQYSGVVWVLLAAPAVVREPLRARDAFAVAAALGGIALFFLADLDAHGRTGDLVALLSGVFYAGIVLLLRRERGGGAEAAITWGNVLAAAALAPAVLGRPLPSVRSMAILVFLGAVQIGVAYVLFVRGIAHVPAARASLLTMVEPIANPIWVFLLLGEAPALPSLAGAAIVLGAITWRTLGVRPSAPAAGVVS